MIVSHFGLWSVLVIVGRRHGAVLQNRTETSVRVHGAALVAARRHVRLFNVDTRLPRNELHVVLAHHVAQDAHTNILAVNFVVTRDATDLV